jgi:hypothetical protein
VSTAIFDCLQHEASGPSLLTHLREDPIPHLRWQSRFEGLQITVIHPTPQALLEDFDSHGEHYGVVID